ncbi:MAG: CoA transferase [Dermabacter sp.]|nr:CoA transferase [Dermabacter sp.]
MSSISTNLIQRLWDAIDDGIPFDGGPFRLDGPRITLPAAFDVTGLAVGAVGSAYLATARLLAARRGASTVPDVRIDSREASTAFRSESRFTPVGWERPPLWDPIAGNYQTADGWIRLHTNYPYHRAAVESLLDATDRNTVQKRVATWTSVELEQAVAEAGGAAAAMRTREQWLAMEAGTATIAKPVVATTWRKTATGATWANNAQLPFEGVRVLDLTRVIAGPVCTKFLADYGADILRIDPPGFEEVASLLPETTAGKRSAALDLNSAEGRARFDALLADADVLVCGLRADALDGLGYSDAQLRTLNPNLIITRFNAYGWDGPWRNRRGFDSLVQLSSGIAAHATDEGSAPASLPVQALDHATGWLLGAAIARALTRRLTDSQVATINASLIGTANLLFSLPQPEDEPQPESLDEIPMVERSTAWGLARVVGPAGHIEGVSPAPKYKAGPLGRHEARW